MFAFLFLQVELFFFLSRMLQHPRQEQEQLHLLGNGNNTKTSFINVRVSLRILGTETTKA